MLEFPPHYRASPRVVSRDHGPKKTAPLATAFARLPWEHLGLLFGPRCCRVQECWERGWKWVSFLKCGYPQSSSIFSWDFSPQKPHPAIGGTPMYGNPPMDQIGWSSTRQNSSSSTRSEWPFLRNLKGKFTGTFIQTIP